MIVLFFADVVGRPGRERLLAKLPELRRRFEADAVVVNGENAANGTGITPKVADRLFSGGVDVITTGNHIWRYRDIYSYLDEQPRIVRPFNFLPSNPGRGVTIVDVPGGRLGVVNLSGEMCLSPARSPFEVIDEALSELHGVRNILVDFHAEATSEKVAMGFYLDGRVSAVLGTHTHVRTADARVLPKGTAYMTDVGMCGSRDSVIGVRKEQVIDKFLHRMPVMFQVAEEDVWVEGAAIRLDGNGHAVCITPFEERAE
ncbi:MAG: TIGR00282 family metallophosphoesterase [Gaiellales bacterium]|nr:TIGR00282 family metallophosphoesterase [Gaiellales bacterium]